MIKQISISQWLSLGRDTQAKLRELFRIPKTGHTEVVDSVVMMDGTTAHDLSTITDEALAKYVGETGTFLAKFERLLRQIDDAYAPEAAPIIPEAVPETPVVTPEVTDIPAEAPVDVPTPDEVPAAVETKVQGKKVKKVKESKQ